MRDLPRDRVLDILAPGLRRISQDVSGPAFLDDVSFNGLLVEREHGRYAFAHLTFQEYLAARHIQANNRADVLTAVVEDSWWRETTLLYTAVADSDLIVQACLDSGSITALALAFDCSATGHELAPDLRARLDKVLAAALEDDCDPAYRRMVAAVLAVRLARDVVVTAGGTRVCTRPVPTSLYWLFLQDTQATPPDGPCDPTPEAIRPVTGVWGCEALAFVTWMNTITAETQSQFRLPTQAELGEQTVADQLLSLQTDPVPVTTLWTQPTVETAAPGAWVIPGQPDPHIVAGITIRQALAADSTETALVPLLITTAIRVLVRALDRARVLDLERIRDLALVLDLERIRDLALVLDLVRALDRARDLVRDLDRDLVRVRNRDLDRDVALDRVSALTRVRDRVRVSDLALVLTLWSAVGRVLGTALFQLLAVDAPSFGRGEAEEERFAAALASAAGIGDSTQVKVPLDGSLAARVRDACAAGSYPGHGWNMAKVAERLANSAGPMLDQHRPPAASVATHIRTAALALIGSEDDSETFRILAAAVTLIQQRASGRAPVGESVLLALM